jgi:hypothetical protein
MEPLNLTFGSGTDRCFVNGLRTSAFPRIRMCGPLSRMKCRSTAAITRRLSSARKAKTTPGALAWNFQCVALFAPSLTHYCQLRRGSKEQQQMGRARRAAGCCHRLAHPDHNRIRIRARPRRCSIVIASVSRGFVSIAHCSRQLSHAAVLCRGALQQRGERMSTSACSGMLHCFT